MNTIHLKNICPNIFKSHSHLESDIWNHDIVFEKGKIYLIEAQSGTGKSTICSYICGYRNDFQGHLYFDQTDSTTMKLSDWSDLRKNHVSHLIQDLRLFPELTAYENIEIKNRITHYLQKQHILDKMDFLGIADKAETPLGKMSFGQQQRVAMLRALAQPFDFLLLDEPISHLDEYHAQLMGKLLMSEAKGRGAAVIVTSIGKHLDVSYDKVFHL